MEPSVQYSPKSNTWEKELWRDMDQDTWILEGSSSRFLFSCEKRADFWTGSVPESSGVIQEIQGPEDSQKIKM